MSPIETKLVMDLPALAALEPQWWELWARCAKATPFQSPAWLLSWWEEFHPGKLLCGTATVGGQLVALFPFYLEDDNKAAPRLLPIGISLSDYIDVLLDPNCPGAGDAVVKLMSDARWGSWSFEEMAPGSAAADLACPECSSDAVSRQETCPVLDIREARDVESSVPARRRRQLRRACVLAARLGEIHIRRCEADSEHFLDRLFALHGARWREREESGVLADRQVQNFHRAVLPRLSAAGLARCYILALEGQPIGAYYGFIDNERAYAYLGGFDPNFAEASPGAILVGHAIGDAIVEGAKEFHFLRGPEPYKYSWGARDRWNARRVWTKALAHA